MIFDREKNNYTLYGALFGIAFPIGAIVLELILRDLSFSVESVIYLHQEILLLWMIDSAPLWLGLFARVAGIKQDSLSDTIANMQATIDERTRYLEASKNAAEKAAEEKSRLSDLSQLATRASNSQQLAREALSLIAQLSQSNVGVLYICQQNTLHLHASYALETNSSHPEQIQLGESLLGQCAVEKRIMHIDALEPDYLSISTSMGKGQANAIVLLPLMFEGKLLGIVELGSFKAYEDECIDFLAKACGVISASLYAALSQERLAETIR